MDEACRQMEVKSEKELRNTPSFVQRREFLLAQEAKKYAAFSKLSMCLRAFLSRLGWR